MYIVCQLVHEAGVLSARFCKQTLRLVLYGDKQYIYIYIDVDILMSLQKHFVNARTEP